jgi:hypothetical protein
MQSRLLALRHFRDPLVLLALPALWDQGFLHLGM